MLAIITIRTRLHVHYVCLVCIYPDTGKSLTSVSLSVFSSGPGYAVVRRGRPLTDVGMACHVLGWGLTALLLLLLPATPAGKLAGRQTDSRPAMGTLGFTHTAVCPTTSLLVIVMT